MLLTVDNFRAKFKSTYHFSKEFLVSVHSTHVVPQGSPLVVSKLFFINKLSSENITFSGHLPFYYTLA